MPRRTRPPRRSDSGDAFIRESEQRTGTRDELAEHLAEQFERSITTGEADDDTSDERLQLEEIGGPFIESAADREFGDTRASTDDAEPNPVPEAVGSLVVASVDEEQEAVEEDAERTDGDVDAPPADAERPSQLIHSRDAIAEASDSARR